MAKINIRTWLTWFLESCAQNGGQVPSDIDPFGLDHRFGRLRKSVDV
jgi:hypothetical protein